MEKRIEDMTGEEWVAWKIATAPVPQFITVLTPPEEWEE